MVYNQCGEEITRVCIPIIILLYIVFGGSCGTIGVDNHTSVDIGVSP